MRKPPIAVRGRCAIAGFAALAALVVGGCGSSGADRPHRPPGDRARVAARPDPRLRSPTTRRSGLPPRRKAHDVYVADGPGMLSSAVRGFPARVYVPNSESDTVDVIDPRSFKVVRHFAVGALPQHVTPSYDLKTLWVDNDRGNSLTPIDPATGRPGRPVPVTDPYNLYFTPDGREAIVVAEARQRLDFRDAHTMRLRHALSVPCRGVDHLDFTSHGRYLVASCEFAGRLIEVDLKRQKVAGTLPLRADGMPQDVRLSPDGRLFYVADMMAGGVWLVDAAHFRKVGFLRTGRGAHGLVISRDARELYVSNRGAGSVSVISFGRRKVTKTWHLRGGGSPDMGGVSADGRVLWLSGRYNGVVYAIGTRTGRLLARVKVGAGPHGLSVYPQPGRYSLGHTGTLR
jgi:YVTN family beta-propeller protein